MLVALASLLARDVAARREIEAERAQHRTTVRWIGIFVTGFTVFSILNRSYSAPFGTVAGQVVLALVARPVRGRAVLAAPAGLAAGRRPVPGRRRRRGRARRLRPPGAAARELPAGARPGRPR